MGQSSSRSNKPSRRDTWTCRLPVELMDRICENLTNDRALATLASLQTTSSSTYTLVTTYLYRHVEFDTRHAVLFLDLFNGITRGDKKRFLQFKEVDNDIHLLVQTPGTRLRSLMSYTKSPALIAHQDMRLQYPKDHARLKGYYKLQNLLGSMKGCTPLWPILNRCHIDLTAWPRHSSRLKKELSSSNKSDVPEMAPLVDILFSKLHPEFMSVITPDRLLDFSTDICQITFAAFWWNCIQRLHAEHIEIAGLWSTGMIELLPRPSKSLTLRIDRSPPYNPNVIAIETESYRLNTGLTQRAAHVLKRNDRGALYQIDTLRFIGIIRPGEYEPQYTYCSFEERVWSGVGNAMNRLMKERSEFGNKKDLRMCIMPDPSSEIEAEETWHTFKVPEIQRKQLY